MLLPCHTHREHNDLIYKYNEMLPAESPCEGGAKAHSNPLSAPPIPLTATAEQRVIVPFSM